MRKKVEVILNPCEEKFDFGCCATLAIASAFDLNKTAMRAICTALGFKVWWDGLDFNQIKKIINLLDHRKEIKYIPNITAISYSQLCILFPENSFLVMFDEHLSYAKNGQIYDTHILDQGDFFRKDWLNNQKVTGWWKIN